MLHYPVFRLGFVIASGRAIQSQTAEKIAETVMAEQDTFRQVIFDCVDRDGDAGRLAEDLNGLAHARRTPAIVIDFWPVEATVKGYKVEIRSCVTICVNRKQSKCWTRINIIEDRIDEEGLDALFDSFDRLARAINERIFGLYGSIITKALGRSIELTKYYELSVRTAAHEEDWVEDYFKAVFSTRELDGDLDQLREKLDATLTKMNSDLRQIPKPGRTITRGGKTIKQIAHLGNRSPHRRDAPFSSSHRTHSVYVVEYSDTSANFTGIGYDPYVSKKMWFKESLSHVASANLAVEYGSLF